MFEFDYDFVVTPETNIIKTIFWKMTHKDSGEFINGHTDLPEPNEHFIPFEKLTEDEVLKWICERHDMNNLESILIENAKNNLEKEKYEIIKLQTK